MPVVVEEADGKWQLVTSHTPGKTLEELMAERPQKMDEYLDQFIDFQVDVHNHRAPLLQR